MAKLIDLRPGEGRPVAWLLFHSFCSGVALVLTESAAQALFLTVFDAASLPYVYMASAALVPIVAMVYMRLSERLPAARLMFFNLVAVLATMAALRLALGLGFDKAAAALLPVLLEIQIMLLVLEFDGLIGSMFSLRQGKRIFPLVGSGEVIAGILGGLSVPLVVGYIGTSNLLVVAVVAMSFSMLAYVRLQTWRPVRQQATEGGTTDEAKPVKPLQIVTAILAFGVLADMTIFFNDNIFYAHVESRYTDVDALAGFVGMYMAISGILALAARVLLASRVYQRFGLSGGLAVLPVMLLTVALPLAILPQIGFSGDLFWLGVALLLSDDIFRKSTGRTGILLMLSALPEAIRVRTQTKLEMAGALAGGAAGLMLLALNWIGPEAMVWALVPILSVLLGLSLWIQRPYVAAMSQALKKQLVLSGDTAIVDRSSLNILRGYLSRPEPALVMYALGLLKNVTLGRDEIRTLLAHPAVEVRREGARMAARRAKADAFDDVLAQVEIETDGIVLAELLTAALTLNPQRGKVLAQKFATAADLHVRRHALAGLLKLDGAAGETQGMLSALVTASEPALRETAAAVMGDVGGLAYESWLMQLLADADRTVYRAAIRAAGGVPSIAVIDKLLAELHDSLYSADEIAALRAHGQLTVERIRMRLADAATLPHVKAKLLYTLAPLNEAGVRELFWQHMDAPNRNIRATALAGLLATDSGDDAGHAATVRGLVEEELADAGALDAVMAATGAAQHGKLLAELLTEERQRCRNRALDAMALLYRGTAFVAVRAHLSASGGEQKDLAIEASENVLSREDRMLLAPLFAEVGVATEDDTGGITVTPLALLSDTRRWLHPLSRLLLADNLGQPHMQEETLAELRQASDVFASMTPAGLAELWQRLALLRGASFFSRAGIFAVAELAQSARKLTYAPNDTLIVQGEPGDSLYVVADGKIRIHRDGQTLVELGAGVVVGEMAVLDPEPRSASVTALVETTVYELDRDHLHTTMREHPDVALSMMKVLIERLRNVAT